MTMLLRLNFCLFVSVLLLSQRVFALGVAEYPDYSARVVINIPSRTLWLYSEDKIVAYFPVGVGRPAFPTPLGKYKIVSKIQDPGWENPYRPIGEVRMAPGKGNPLGTRWLGFKRYRGGEYGIHGTNEPQTVGRFSSHGCVRMKIKDSEILFSHVDFDTPVDVVYQPVLVRQKQQEIYVVVYPDIYRKGMPTLNQVRQQILQQFPDADIDLTVLKLALKQMTQKPVTVGKIRYKDSI